MRNRKHDKTQLNHSLNSILKVKNLHPLQKHLIDFVRSLYLKPSLAPELFFHAKSEAKANRLRRSDGRETICLLLAACIASINLGDFKLGSPIDNGDFRETSWKDILRFLPDGYKTPQGRPMESIYKASKVLQRLNILGVVTKYEVMENGDKRAVPAIKWLNKDWFVKVRAVKYAWLARVSVWAKRKRDTKLTAWQKKNPGYNDHNIAEREWKNQLENMLGEEETVKLLSRSKSGENIDTYLRLIKMGFNASTIRRLQPELFS